MKVALLFIIFNFADGKGNNESSTSTSGLVDFIREAVWGDAKEGGGAYGEIKTPRHDHHTMSIQTASGTNRQPELISSIIGGEAREKARKLMQQVEVEADGRTVNSITGETNGGCYVGACCGWGHRLMRQAKSFTHVHYLQNRTMLMEW